jgi:DNA-binding IclR family transcriptional regulator
MIIALQPAERRAAMIRDSYALIEMPPPLDRLNEQLDRIAAAGSIIAASHHLVGITDICAPVLDRSGRAMACLSAPCLQRVGMEWRFEDIRDRMVEACRDMSQALL